MTTFRIEPKNLGKYEKELARSLKREMRDAAFFAASKSVPYLKERTRNALPANPSGVGPIGAVATKAYHDAWKARKSGDSAEVYNDAPYAVIVELGRRPGARPPPSGAIADWLTVKGVSEEMAARIAYVVARSIGRRGLRGRGILSGALPRIAELFDIQIDKMLIRVFNESIER